MRWTSGAGTQLRRGGGLLSLLEGAAMALPLGPKTCLLVASVGSFQQCRGKKKEAFLIFLII